MGVSGAGGGSQARVVGVGCQRREGRHRVGGPCVLAPPHRCTPEVGMASERQVQPLPKEPGKDAPSNPEPKGAIARKFIAVGVFLRRILENWKLYNN